MSQKRLVIKDELKRLCDELTYNPPAVFETALYVSSAGCTSVYLVNVACHSGPNMELWSCWDCGIMEATTITCHAQVHASEQCF